MADQDKRTTRIVGRDADAVEDAALIDQLSQTTSEAPAAMSRAAAMRMTIPVSISSSCAKILKTHDIETGGK